MLTGVNSRSVIDYRILTASGNYIWILDRAVGYQMDINQDSCGSPDPSTEIMIDAVLPSGAYFAVLEAEGEARASASVVILPR